jgi:hypothetical protein
VHHPAHDSGATGTSFLRQWPGRNWRAKQFSPAFGHPKAENPLSRQQWGASQILSLGQKM